MVVVRDAVAGPKLPDGDGYLSALVNFRDIASAVNSTDEVLQHLRNNQVLRSTVKNWRSHARGHLGLTFCANDGNPIRTLSAKELAAVSACEKCQHSLRAYVRHENAVT